MSSGYNGYLMLNKEIKRHEYFTDYKTFHLFFWLLSDANFIDGNCNGVLVKRGQKMTSYRSLVIETGLTEREVRTALEKLINSNHVKKIKTNKYQLLTVVEYEYYTAFDESKDKQTTNERQTKDKPTTTIEEFNNTKKEEFNKIERVNKSSLSHFDFLSLNFNKELLELITDYKPKINDWDFCIEKFNNMNYKRVTVTAFKKWLKDELDWQNKNSNSVNQNEKVIKLPQNKRILFKPDERISGF